MRAPDRSVLPAKMLSPNVDGLLGAGLLRNFDLNFDFGNRTLNLMSRKHCKGQVVYWTADYASIAFTLSRGQHLVIPMQLDGKRVKAVIDTGATQTVLGEARARRLFGLSENSPGVELPGSGVIRGCKFGYRFGSLSFEGVTVKRPLVHVCADDTERAFWKNHIDDWRLYDPRQRPELDGADLVVGMSILKDLRLYVSYDEEVLYASAAGAR